MPAPARREVSREFEPNADSPRLARRFVAGALDDAEVTGARDAAMLLVSELVTNAVLHARTPVEVELTIDAPRIRVAISDGSPAMPAVRNFSATAASGRGLHLVDTLATRWGVDVAPDSSGKSVWFELDDQTEPAASDFDLDSVPSL